MNNPSGAVSLPLLLSLLLLLPVLVLGQLLLPSTHSPEPLLSSASSSSNGRSCACPPKAPSLPVPVHSIPIPVQKAKTKAKARAKAHHRPQEDKPKDKSTALVLDQSLMGALQDVGQKLAPFKSGKGKKRKGAGRTRKRRPKRQASRIVDPALAGPEGAKCNSQRIREVIRKARDRDNAALKRNIQALAERAFSARFNVVCARGDFSYISNTEEFCQERVNGNTCYVFRQLGRDLPFPEPPQLDQFERSIAKRGRLWQRRKKAKA